LAITKEEKGDILKGYLDLLSKAQGLVFTEYRGMGMKNLNTIRAALRAAKGTYTITKNTLFKIALRETGFPVPDEMLTGPTAVAIAFDNVGTLTKAVLARQKEDELLILKGAVMGQTIFRADQLEALSTLPTLDEARASLIGTLQQPASLLVGLLSQPGQGLAGVLKAYTDKAGAEGEGAAA
jgi:large subunit ribosomal protein L10